MLHRFVVAFACLFISVSMMAQGIDVVNRASANENDTLIFKGLRGNSEASAMVASDLKNCGWFDVLQSGTPNYLVSGTASADGREITLELANGAGARISSIRATGSTITATSHKAVDTLLKSLYNIPGICSSKIAFVVQTGPEKKEIYVCDYDGRNPERLTRNNGLSLDPVWTPDNRSVIYSFVGRTYTSLIEHRYGTSHNRRLASFAGLNAGGRVSPDGRKIALILSKDNKVDLYVRDLNGGNLKRLTFDSAVEASPCWSPDSRKICFVSDGGNAGRPRLRVISVDGGASRPISGVLGSESVSPTWSADNKIVYSAKLGNYMVAVADPTGRAFSKNGKQKFGVISKGGGDWESPSWAPDHRHVVCSNRGALHVVDTWSGKSRRILGGPSALSLPDWSGLFY